MFKKLLAALERRAALRREAGRLVVNHGLHVALMLGRLRLPEDAHGQFERLARRCDRDLQGLDTSTRYEVAGRWTR